MSGERGAMRSELCIIIVFKMRFAVSMNYVGTQGLAISPRDHGGLFTRVTSWPSQGCSRVNKSTPILTKSRKSLAILCHVKARECQLRWDFVSVRLGTYGSDRVIFAGGTIVGREGIDQTNDLGALLVDEGVVGTSSGSASSSDGRGSQSQRKEDLGESHCGRAYG